MKTMKKLPSFPRWAQRIALVVAMLAFFAATFVLQAGSASAHETAWVRVVHAAPAAGNVDVYVDQQKLLDKFAFGSVTDYVQLGSGKHRIEVAPAGAGIGASVIDVHVWVKGGTYYTLAALSDKDAHFSLKAFVDNNRVPDDKAAVRVYHLSPDAGPVDVAAGDKTVIKDLTYRHASGYLKVAPDTYTFNVTAVNVGAKVPLSATLKADTVYSVFALGLLNGNPSLRFVVAAVPGKGD